MEPISKELVNKIRNLGNDEYLPIIIDERIYMIFSLEHYKKILDK